MKIFATIVTVIIPMLEKVGVPFDVLIEAARAGADAFLDRIEEKIESTETPIDDVLIGSVIDVARTLIGIEETVDSKYADRD